MRRDTNGLDPDSKVGRITAALDRIRAGDPAAEEDLVREAYQHIYRIAENRMRGERAGHLLQPTALVNEAFIALRQLFPKLDTRRQLFGAMKTAMRRILYRHAKYRESGIPVQDTAIVLPISDEILSLGQGLEALEHAHPRGANVVWSRFMMGLTIPETAANLGVSHATVERDWPLARAWLYRYLG